MSIHISATSTAEEQLQLCRTYLHSQIQRCGFSTRDNNNIDIRFLPPSAIDNFAAQPNIEALCVQDPGLKRLHFPSHSHKFFAEKVFKNARKCFVITVLENLGMDFLLQLSNVANDEDLPISEHEIANRSPIYREVTNPEFPHDLRTFMGSQALVCGPRLEIGRSDQIWPSMKNLPLVEAHLHHQRSYGDVFRVVFHPEFLVAKGAGSEEPYTGEVSFRMKVFYDVQEVSWHVGWGKRMFGFGCDGKYYVCYRPSVWVSL
jgi:hypothetical protein